MKFDLINSRQFGFRSLHSTVTALLDLTNQWYYNIDRGMINGVLFLDLKKAFDTVDHNILLTKLSFLGICDKTLHWFKSYFTDRTQQCYVNGYLSGKVQVKSGVAQGSVLGPLLFLIYINDLTTSVNHGTARMYADDTNVSFSACVFSELQRQMKKDLEHLESWLIANKLTLNTVKTESMVVDSKQRINSLVGDLTLSLKGKWQYIFLFPRLKQHLKPYRKLFYCFFISCLLLQIF